jgi:cytochrome c biogenesis protein CcdA
MVELLLAAIGLGVAGIDPVGALIAIGALSGGARERIVIAYGVTVIGVTVVLGVVLSLTVGSRLADTDWRFLDSGYEFWAYGEAVVGMGLAVWAIWRILSPAEGGDQQKKRGGSGLPLLGTGILFGLSSVSDPTFVATVVLAGRHGSVLDASLAHLIWILLSQVPLVFITGAVLAGRHEPVVRQFQRWWEKGRPVIARIGISMALVAGTLLLVDAGWWFFTGEFLFDL